jgi:hypothetical protein
LRTRTSTSSAEVFNALVEFVTAESSKTADGMSSAIQNGVRRSTVTLTPTLKRLSYQGMEIPLGFNSVISSVVPEGVEFQAIGTIRQIIETLDDLVECCNIA